MKSEGMGGSGKLNLGAQGSMGHKTKRPMRQKREFQKVLGIHSKCLTSGTNKTARVKCCVSLNK